MPKVTWLVNESTGIQKQSCLWLRAPGLNHYLVFQQHNFKFLLGEQDFDKMETVRPHQCQNERDRQYTKKKGTLLQTSPILPLHVPTLPDSDVESQVERGTSVNQRVPALREPIEQSESQNVNKYIVRLEGQGDTRENDSLFEKRRWRLTQASKDGVFHQRENERDLWCAQCDY